jgi:hypothetical protein
MMWLSTGLVRPAAHRVRCHVMVDFAFVGGENRLKAFRIEIAVVDDVSRRRQRLNDAAMDRRLKAVLERVDVNHEAELVGVAQRPASAC